jgi:phosphate/sulfate permease
MTVYEFVQLFVYFQACSVITLLICSFIWGVFAVEIKRPFNIVRAVFDSSVGAGFIMTTVCVALMANGNSDYLFRQIAAAYVLSLFLDVMVLIPAVYFLREFIQKRRQRLAVGT